MSTAPAAAPIDVDTLLDESRWSGYQKWLVLLTAITIVFDGIDNQLLGVTIPSLMRDFHVPRSAFASVVALGYVGMMVGGAVAGLAGDRVGRRVALLGSLAVFGVATLAAATVGSVGGLGWLRMIAGIGLGGAVPNAAALAAEYAPRNRRPFAVTLTIVCVPLGATLAGLIALYALPAIGWRGFFVLGGVVPIAAAALLPAGLPESPRYLVGHPRRSPALPRFLRRAGHAVDEAATFAAGPAGEPVARARFVDLFGPAYLRDTLLLWLAFFS